ncbi:hypothetical protein [Effusibacillus pohliae]|uniref:hypothetical protein n=1 Tax=Effusibacillus pohliae TaxID=232270 RepID=UPI00036D60D2|nr:hypothetical protein [Effusibacillus pohliae]
MRSFMSHLRFGQRLLQAVVLALPLAAALGGCSPQLSAPNSNEIPLEQKEKKPAPDGWAKIVESVEKSRQISKFGISGTLETREQNRFHRSSVYGHVILPDQAEMSQSVDGRSYYIFQDKTSAYYREEGVWRPISRLQLPDPWDSLQKLAKIQPPRVDRLEDMTFLKLNDTEVYQFEADAIDVAGLPVSQGKKMPSRYTIYIDKDTRFIRQIQILSTSEVDDIGTVVTTATIKFFDQNNKDVQISMPASLKEQLKKRE